MSTREVSRIIIEIPKEQHKRLKARAALLGKSMRELVLETLESNEACSSSSHIPNEVTLKSIANIEEGKNFTEFESVTRIPTS